MGQSVSAWAQDPEPEELQLPRTEDPLRTGRWAQGFGGRVPLLLPSGLCFTKEESKAPRAPADAGCA